MLGFRPRLHDASMNHTHDAPTPSDAATASRTLPWLRIVGIWLLILAFAIANGGIRESLLLPALGNPAAQLLSGIVLASAILAAAWWLLPPLGAQSRYRLVGALWLALTLVFEFGFGRAQGKSWEQLLAAYTFEDGNLWPVVLVVTLLAPAVAGRWRRRYRPPA